MANLNTWASQQDPSNLSPLDRLLNQYIQKSDAPAAYLMRGDPQGLWKELNTPKPVNMAQDMTDVALNANPMMGLLGIKDVLPQLTKFQQERLIKAADLVPNLEKQYTDKALKGAFSGGRSSDGGNLFTVIKPHEFTSLHTYPIPEKPHGLLYMNPSDLSYNNIDNLVGAPNQDVYMKHLANVLRKRGGFDEVPYFMMDVKEGYKNIIPDRLSITGHEGRHRTTALDKRGDYKTLVEILPRGEFRNAEKYRVKNDWGRNDEISQHYLDMVRKYFDSGASTRYLYPQVNNQADDAYNYLPIF